MEGFLPYDVHSLEKQAERAYRQLKKQPTHLLQVSVGLEVQKGPADSSMYSLPPLETRTRCSSTGSCRTT